MSVVVNYNGGRRMTEIVGILREDSERLHDYRLVKENVP